MLINFFLLKMRFQFASMGENVDNLFILKLVIFSLALCTQQVAIWTCLLFLLGKLLITKQHGVCEDVSVMSNSLQPYGLQPTRLHSPQDSPGKNNGVDCHALLQGILPTQGLNPCLLCLLHWASGFFTIVPCGKPQTTMYFLL